ncbi:MAG: nuclear transport factor 2 family protein [Blastocatellia bacterium]
MTGDEFHAMLAQMAEGWTRRDYETVANRFSERIKYVDPLNYSFDNRESLLEFFRDDDGKPQLCELHNAVFDDITQIGTAEYTYEGTFRYHGTVWIELADDKIVSWREYQHKSEKDWNAFWKIDE